MDKTTYAIELCRGVTGTRCPHSGPMAPSLPDLLHKAVEHSGWLAREDRHGRDAHHKRLRIAATACPNGCSRPQVADIGIMLARVPKLRGEYCTGCAQCAEACPDRAIRMDNGEPVIDRDLCLRCGKCADVCPEGAMVVGESGLRVLLGGKLGRHPRFGAELPGLFAPEQAATLVRLAIARVLGSEHRGRFADVLFADGQQRALQELLDQLRSEGVDREQAHQK